MKGERCDAFRRNPTDWTIRTYRPRALGKLEGLEKMPPLCPGGSWVAVASGPLGGRGALGGRVRGGPVVSGTLLIHRTWMRGPALQRPDHICVVDGVSPWVACACTTESPCVATKTCQVCAKGCRIWFGHFGRFCLEDGERRGAARCLSFEGLAL